jgi:hypothetical protein
MKCIYATNLQFGNKENLSPRILISIWFAFLLSSALIIAAARGDLWMDEIWSLSFARNAHSFRDVFVCFYDNNHPLNTLFLYCVGEQKTLYIYRLLAVLSGIGSVFFVGYIARKEWGYPEALCSIVLTGTSYPLLLYFSEARGYAPAIFFSLVSYAALRHNMQHFRLVRLVLFWATSILGILSHTTFIMLIMACVVGSLAHEVYGIGSFRGKALRFMAHHIPPLIFFAWWYMFFVKNLVIGGGPIYGTWTVIGQASALLSGFPDALGFRGAAILLVLALVALGTSSLLQERDMQGPFFLTILLFSPALLLIVTQPKYLYFRYFVICFPFFFLLLSYLVCKCYRLFPYRWRCLLFGAMIMLIAGQAQRDYLLLKHGRGQYSAALEYISESSPKGIVRVGSDHDFRNQRLFDFYSLRVAAGNNLRYVKQPKWHEELPDWILTHSQDVSYQPQEGLDVKGIGIYRLIHVYRFSGISGWNWFLFKRET